MIADPTIRIGNFRVDPQKLVGTGWRGWMARLFNKIRLWADTWAIHFVLQVVTNGDPIVAEKALEHSQVTDRFRDFRGGHTPGRTGMPISNENEHTMARLARLTAEPRSKRYTVGRRVYTLYEVEDGTPTPGSIHQQRRPAVAQRGHERSRVSRTIEADAAVSAVPAGTSEAPDGVS